MNTHVHKKHYAGFWVRLGANMIDGVIVLLFVYLPLSLIYDEQDYWFGDSIFYGFWDVMLGYIMPFMLTIWFWLRFLGTPGKMMLRLKVVNVKTGKALSVGKAVGRYFAYIISALPFGLGFIWIAIDQKKQGWHDKLVGSVVIMESLSVKFEGEE